MKTLLDKISLRYLTLLIFFDGHTEKRFQKQSIYSVTLAKNSVFLSATRETHGRFGK